MATSAFKSTTKRTPIRTTSGNDESVSSNSSHRRSRSLSRLSRPLPESDFAGEAPVPTGRFVNTVRGSGFPEISLDDLALEFFPLKDLPSPDERESSDKGQSSRRTSEIGRWASATASSERRGRSVSRHQSRAGEGRSSVSRNSRVVGSSASEANSRRRRSVSVVRYQISDSESDVDHSLISTNHANTKSNSGTGQIPLSHKPTTPSNQRLGRSRSHKDLSKLPDGYSSHSSALTDDEGRPRHSGKNGIEKTIRTVYAQNKADHPSGDDLNVNSRLYEAMRKELRCAVKEIRTELEQVMVRKSSVLDGNEDSELNNKSDLPAFSAVRKTYAKKLEQSEKRKQDLLTEMMLEEQRARELSKIFEELVADPKSSAVPQKPLQARKRSNERNKVSKRLTEEAEKYFEDFISNVEDTDISSLDGERSDASSSLGGIPKPKDGGRGQAYQSPVVSNSIPVEMDGVILPWLRWDSNDASPSPPPPCETDKQTPVTPKTSWEALKGFKLKEDMSSGSGTVSGDSKRVISGFDMEEYFKLQQNEELLFEKWKQRHRIHSGGLLLCTSFSNHVM